MPPPSCGAIYDPLAGFVSVIDVNTFVYEVSGWSRVWYRPKAEIEPPLCQEQNTLGISKILGNLRRLMYSKFLKGMTNPIPMEGARSVYA